MPHPLLKDQSADLAIVLGSGLNAVSDAIQTELQLPYADITGLSGGRVEGHSGVLTLGRLNNLKVVCFQGRPHWYEGVDAQAFLTMMSIPKALGCKQVFITNAAGAINDAYNVGDLVMITDHINLQGKSPLQALFPPAFVGMDSIYDDGLQQSILSSASSLNIEVKKGVYTGVLGPNFETPAEIRAMKHMGGDLVGMSTVPEVIAARYYDLHVGAISVVSNMAAGISDVSLSHEVTLEGAQKGCQNLSQLIHQFCRDKAAT